MPRGGASSLPAREFGLRPAPVRALAGGDAACNLSLLERVLDGEAGPLQDAVLLNAAVAIFLADAGAGRSDGLSEAFARGREALASGAAKRLLARAVSASRRAAGEAA